MSVLTSATITLSYVTSVESETRYYLLQISTLQPPTKPTTNPPTGGWSQTEPTYDNTKATSTLYTCVLTKFTDGTFRYSEVSVSSSYEAAKSAYNQAHEANAKLASWCAENDVTLIDGGKIATGTVITNALAANSITADKIKSKAITTEKLDANAVTAEKIDVTNLFSQDITASGKIKSNNYNGTDTNPLGNTAGTILKMDNGTFNFGGGKMIWDGSDLSIDGKISGKNIYICGTGRDYIGNDGSYIDKTNLIQTSTKNTGDYDDSSVTFEISQTYSDYEATSGSRESSSASIKFVNGKLYLYGVENLTSHANYHFEYITDDVQSYAGTSAVTSASIKVTEYLGMCFVFGGVTPKQAASSWVTLLSSAEVPPPADGYARYITVPTWTSSYTRPLRIAVAASGSLRMRYGAANEFQFSLVYPC